MKSFEETLANMCKHNMKLPQRTISIVIPNAREVLYNYLTQFVAMEGRTIQWLPEYEEVARWLTNNKGKGIFIYGSCGRGKSLLCRYVLPAILLNYAGKVVSVFDIQEMNRDIDYVLSKQLISLDDIGSEDQSVKYGERRLAFSEIMDAAEKNSKLIMVSSNLTGKELRDRYGDRTLDRIKATTTRIIFQGESLRA